MRLIDADALIQKRNHAKAYAQDMYVIGQGYVMDAPTIDAVPVVRGEWIVDECDSTDDVPSRSWIDFHCSECNMDYGLEEGQYGWDAYGKIPYQYCPHCGAKMGDKP